mgnify:CR=1 FL=1
MGYNIEWANPEKTLVYSFQGRLYQSKSTVMIQKRNHDERIARWIDERGTHNEDGELWWFLKSEPCPVYEVEWIWRELDDEECQS